jgi:hypothetical protein
MLSLMVEVVHNHFVLFCRILISRCCALLGLLRFTPAEMPHSAAVSIATSTLSGGTGHGVAEAGAAVVGAAITAGALASTSGGGGLVVAFETEVCCCGDGEMLYRLVYLLSILNISICV